MRIIKAFAVMSKHNSTASTMRKNLRKSLPCIHVKDVYSAAIPAILPQSISEKTPID
jgi:hypothetical protein